MMRKKFEEEERFILHKRHEFGNYFYLIIKRITHYMTNGGVLKTQMNGISTEEIVEKKTKHSTT